MINTIETLHQYFAVYVFTALSIIGAIKGNWDLGFGVNFALVWLYVFLYLQPLQGLIK
ncbi:hypothetical protein LCGC14_2725630 [marine sediment metagenome]|uniref:Uncharacterized protein n=1 Tax=marine sediment metagenome TaxID=412755 RepID=A0A0F9BHU0_9ZZZZ